VSATIVSIFHLGDHILDQGICMLSHGLRSGGILMPVDEVKVKAAVARDNYGLDA
jgi:hypothetical protein